jgi:protein-disulfide isomerase/uncharacterized membrane protein
MKKRPLLLLTTLAGVCNGIWMLILHIQYEKLGGVCSVSETISCEVLTYKQYSEWLGVPSPVYALFTYIVLFILAFRGWKNIGAKRVREDAFAFLLSNVALLAGIVMASISFFVLKKLCVYCFIYYIIIFATWLLAKSIAGSHGEKACVSLKREVSTFYKSQWFWLTGIAFTCVIAFSHFAFIKTSTLSEATITIKGDEMKTSGNPNSKVTMTIFSDFQCPACKHAAGVLKELESTEYASKIRVTYKFFPLDPSCNKGAPYGQHLMACDAAKAAVCAGQQQKFWRFHDKLFENQQSLYEKKFFQIAEEESLDMDKFGACFYSAAALEEVKKDIDEGVSIRISATPTIFFNGKKFEGHASLEEFKKTIDLLLKKQI